IERDPAMLALAWESIHANGLSDRVEAQLGDVAEGATRQRLSGFDAALANPPFFDDPDALRAPHPAKAGAWIADAGLAAWLTFLATAVRDEGTITLIHRADRLADILAGLSAKAG